MHSINAVSLAPDVNNWLANSRHPQFLHVFDQACNLINERREILSIVSPQIGNGPFNLVVQEDVLFSDHLKAESKIFIRPNQLVLENLSISLGNAKLWSPRPNWGTLHEVKDNIRRKLTLLLPVTNYQPSLPASLLATFSAALVSGDLPAALTTTRQLAGLGQGLTPAGDDFIMGAIHATWIIHPSEVARVLAEEVTNTAAPLTTSLSAAWLKSAGRGEVGILWHDFFDGLISGEQAAIEDLMNKILAVGETSGADALAGFVNVLLHSAQSTRPKTP